MAEIYDLPAARFTGLLCIGDPHLATRNPGFRRDDYANNILKKLEWSLRYAEQHGLLPVLLGDLFHYPRDNANWLLVRLLDLFRDRIIAVAGNHDCHENDLAEDDTLSILAAAGHVRLLERTGPWVGVMNGLPAVVNGTPWNRFLPKSYDPTEALAPLPPDVRTQTPLVFWLAHHDLRFPGNEESARTNCKEIPGVDVVINGHIHRPLEDVACGCTTWLNPGNIARVSRGDASRLRKPSVLRLDITPDRSPRWSKQVVELPHLPFEEVFHPEMESLDVQLNESLFIRGLAQLESFKTAAGEGLLEFLNHNLDQFDAPVAKEIRDLAEEVLNAHVDPRP